MSTNDGTLAIINQWKQIIANMSNSKGRIVMHEGGRIASATDTMKERGSVTDRLAQTDEEAEAIAGADDARLGKESEIPSNMTPEQEEALDDAVVDRLIDDMIEKTFLRGM